MTYSKIHATFSYDDIRVLLATYFNLNVCREITYYTYSVLERAFDTFHIIWKNIYTYIFTICCIGIDCLSYPTLQWHNGEIYFPNKRPICCVTFGGSSGAQYDSWRAPHRSRGPTNWDRQKETYNNLTGELFHQFCFQVLETNRSYLRTKRLSFAPKGNSFSTPTSVFQVLLFRFRDRDYVLICLDAYDALACCL